MLTEIGEVLHAINKSKQNIKHSVDDIVRLEFSKVKIQSKIVWLTFHPGKTLGQYWAMISLPAGTR